MLIIRVKFLKCTKLKYNELLREILTICYKNLFFLFYKVLKHQLSVLCKNRAFIYFQDLKREISTIVTLGSNVLFISYALILQKNTDICMI